MKKKTRAIQKKARTISKTLVSLKEEADLSDIEIAKMMGFNDRRNVAPHFTKNGKSKTVPLTPTLLKYTALFSDVLKRPITLDFLLQDIKVFRYEDKEGNTVYYTNLDEIPAGYRKIREVIKIK